MHLIPPSLHEDVRPGGARAAVPRHLLGTGPDLVAGEPDRVWLAAAEEWVELGQAPLRFIDCACKAAIDGLMASHEISHGVGLLRLEADHNEAPTLVHAP